MESGKVALITGSTDGVGCEVAKRLVNRRVHVLVHGRDQERGERIVAEITAPRSTRRACADLAHRKSRETKAIHWCVPSQGCHSGVPGNGGFSLERL